ncbi:MAG: disulfide bond formation protein B [Acidimicrobiales bacterium]|nr:disulfide bond formation protein B [Acidimicrobiales bacterium]
MDELVLNFAAAMAIGGLLGAIALALSSDGREFLSENAVALGTAVAVLATATSLYLSEVAGLTPCRLCWFQRMAMYPLALIIPLAGSFGSRKDVARAGLAVAGVGIVVSLYHVQLQAFPEQSSFCEVSNPCTSSPMKAFDLLSIPQLTAVSFAIILVLSFTLLRHSNPTEMETS